MAWHPVADGGGPPDGGDERTIRRFNWSFDSPTVAVVETIAEAEGVDPLDIDSLHRWVDPNALNALLRRHTRGDRGIECRVKFNVGEFVVEVDRSGEVVVSRR